MLLLIDNYDSFTFNLAQAFGQLGEEVRVERNDAIDLGWIRALAPDHVVISPGPCTPTEAGISMEVIRELAGEVPILGVCLGHQAIGQVFGGRVVRAAKVMHGKVSKVFHDDGPLFAGVANPFAATRYHSLVIDPATLPAELVVTAKTWDDVIMGVRRIGDEGDAPLEGLQFHPESIMTPDGLRMLGNFVALGRAFHADRAAAGRGA